MFLESSQLTIRFDRRVKNPDPHSRRVRGAHCGAWLRYNSSGIE